MAERFQITYPTQHKHLDGMIERLEEERRKDPQAVERLPRRIAQCMAPHDQTESLAGSPFA